MYLTKDTSLGRNLCDQGELCPKQRVPTWWNNNQLIISRQMKFPCSQLTPKAASACLNNYVLRSNINSAFLCNTGILNPELTKSKTYVVMCEETQHLKFPVGSFRWSETLKNVRHLLQSDPLSISWIRHRPARTRNNC